MKRSRKKMRRSKRSNQMRRIKRSRRIKHSRRIKRSKRMKRSGRKKTLRGGMLEEPPGVSQGPHTNVPEDAKQFVCRLASENCRLDTSSDLSKLIYIPDNEDATWEYHLLPRHEVAPLGTGSYGSVLSYRVNFCDKSTGGGASIIQTTIDVAVKFDSDTEENYFYNECGPLSEKTILGHLCKSSELVAAYCSRVRLLKRAPYCIAIKDHHMKDVKTWLRFSKGQKVMIVRESHSNSSLLLGHLEGNESHNRWVDKNYVITGEGCHVIVMELLDNPVNHVASWNYKPEQWIGLCFQILELYSIDPRLIYTDAKIQNCGYDKKTGKLKLLDYGAAVFSSFEDIAVTYPPHNTGIITTDKDGYVKINPGNFEKGACQLMSYSMGILGLEVYREHSEKKYIATQEERDDQGEVVSYKFLLGNKHRDKTKGWDEIKRDIYNVSEVYDDETVRGHLDKFLNCTFSNKEEIHRALQAAWVDLRPTEPQGEPGSQGNPDESDDSGDEF